MGKGDEGGWIMTVDGPQTLARIEAHALNTLEHMPGHVDANDKLMLVREIKRLRAEISDLRRAQRMAHD